MADIDKYVVLKATKTTPFKLDTIAYIIGAHKYYAPNRHRAYTKHADGTFTVERHVDKYYDALWKKYIDSMGEVQRKTVFMLAKVFAKETNACV